MDPEPRRIQGGSSPGTARPPSSPRPRQPRPRPSRDKWIRMRLGLGRGRGAAFIAFGPRPPASRFARPQSAEGPCWDYPRCLSSGGGCCSHSSLVGLSQSPWFLTGAGFRQNSFLLRSACRRQ